MLNASHSSHNTRLYRNCFIAASVIGFIASVVVVRNISEVSALPTTISNPFQFAEWINSSEDWLRQHLKWFTRMIASGIGTALFAVEDFLIKAPWLFVMMFLTLPALRFGGLPLAILTVAGVVFWGGVGMWDVTMQTLALMGISVILSVFFGIILGILSSQNDKFEGFLKPILDTMQTMPAFVYLLPAVFFFGIGGPPAIMATMIYALPPVIRLTNLGIRQISAETLEAAHSFGSTRMQTLFKVQIPISLPSIMLGINQTIMMALGLVVLATFIGAEGLGSEVWKAIFRLRVGWSLEAGICIVFMAIILDRLSLALSHSGNVKVAANTIPFRLLPQNWDIYPAAMAIERIIAIPWNFIAEVMRFIVNLVAIVLDVAISRVGANRKRGARVKKFINNHLFLIGSILILLGILLYDSFGAGIGTFPESWNFSFRKPVDEAIAWLTVNPGFIAFTKGLRTFVYLYLLHPLDVYLTELPWYIVIFGLGVISWVSAGRNFAIVCAILMVFIGACDLWVEAMLTLSSTLVSVFICFVFGLPLGVFSAYNKKFDMMLRPVLDTMQTLPSFVYLIPVLMFFGGNIVSAVIATVIYALPPVIRLTSLGISRIPVTYSEVSSSFGGTSLQTLRKVNLPMAVPSIMLGLNQAVMMALAMQVVTPLIGGGGLGREVFHALNIANTGKGLAAGIGIVLLAIILDRLSQAWTKAQRNALGI